MEIKLDLDDPQGVVDHLRDYPYRGQMLVDIITQIRAQIPKPRIPEPGFAAVVEAHTTAFTNRRYFVCASGYWRDEDVNRLSERWDALLDPVLIREGLEP